MTKTQEQQKESDVVAWKCFEFVESDYSFLMMSFESAKAMMGDKYTLETYIDELIRVKLKAQYNIKNAPKKLLWAKEKIKHYKERLAKEDADKQQEG